MLIQTESVPAPARREDLYAVVHKGLRALMVQTLVEAGSVDPCDDGARRALRDRAALLLDLCEQHLREEDEFIEAAIDRRAPRPDGGTRDEHRAHLAAIASLRALLARDEATADRLDALYRELGAFVAESLAHMDREERENNPRLWAVYSDEELAAIGDALVAKIPPERMRGFLACMLPAMRPGERAAMAQGLRDGAPPEALRGVLEVADAALPPRDAAAMRDAVRS